MPFSEEKITELFQLLDSLGAMGTSELLDHFTSENIDALRLVSALIKERLDLERMLSENRFVSVVRELAETKRIWSGKLDETLKSASREFEQENRVQALWILNGFIRFCPSPYYRERAVEVMEEFEGGV